MLFYDALRVPDGLRIGCAVLFDAQRFASHDWLALFVEKEVGRDGCAEHRIVVAVEKILRQIGNGGYVPLDALSIEQWQQLSVDDSAVVDDAHTVVRRIEPVGAFIVGNDVYAVYPRRIPFRRAQREFQFVVADIAAIACDCHAQLLVFGQIGVFLGTPCRVVAIHPQIYEVNIHSVHRVGVVQIGIISNSL